MTMDHGSDWPVSGHRRDRRERRHRRRDASLTGTLRYAVAVLAVGVTFVMVVIAWDLAQAHGLLGHLPTMPCSL